MLNKESFAFSELCWISLDGYRPSSLDFHLSYIQAIILIEFTSITWSRMMLCNGEITMILEKPDSPFLLLQTPQIMTNSWKIKLFPNPVGKTAITSLPLKRWRIASSCSLFNVNERPDSLSFNRTSLKQDSKPSTSSAILSRRSGKKILRGKVSPVNHWDYAAPIRSPRSWANGFFKNRGSSCRCSLNLSTNFRAACLPKIVWELFFRTGTLATQATYPTEKLFFCHNGVSPRNSWRGLYRRIKGQERKWKHEV